MINKWLWNTIFYSILLASPKPLFAENNVTSLPLLDYSGNLRIVNVDIETLQPDEETIQQLKGIIDRDHQVHPQYSAENYFILGKLAQVENNHEQAHRYFRRISSKNALHSVALYFDAISLREMGKESKSNSEKQKKCQSSLDNLEKIEDLAPKYFRKDHEKQEILSNFCLLEAMIVDRKLGTNEFDWLKQTLENSSAWVDESERKHLFWTYHSKIGDPSDRDKLVSYLDFGLKLFPEDPRVIEEAAKFGLAGISQPDSGLDLKETEKDAQDLLDRAKEHARKQQIKQAFQTLNKIIHNFPGSFTRVAAQEEIMNLIRNEVRYRRAFTGYTEDLKKLPPNILFSIAKFLWNRDYGLTAFGLYKHIISAYPHFEKTPDAYFSLANMHEDWSEWSKAIEYYLGIVQKHPRSKFFERAHFKVGFLYYLSKNYTQAIHWLSKEKKLVTDEHQLAQASYWLGKAYQKLKREKEAQMQFSDIKKKYPLTYYSFLLGNCPTPISKGKIIIEPIKINQDHPLYMAGVFLAVGLHKPAQQMILEYGQESEDHLFQIVRFFHETGFHIYSMPFALSLAEKRSQANGFDHELLEIIFPIRYIDTVTLQAKQAGLDPLIVLSLMKQESGYFERAVSPAQAVGLMQLLVPTAQRVSNERSLKKTDLFNPHKNIELGILYLKGLHEEFSGNIVLVLAAYNAGPERSRKWNNRWPKLDRDEFVEMIPFSETRKYVKLILRNYGFYQFLMHQKAPEPKTFGF